MNLVNNKVRNSTIGPPREAYSRIRGVWGLELIAIPLWDSQQRMEIRYSRRLPASECEWPHWMISCDRGDGREHNLSYLNCQLHALCPQDRNNACRVAVEWYFVLALVFFRSPGPLDEIDRRCNNKLDSPIDSLGLITWEIPTEQAVKVKRNKHSHERQRGRLNGGSSSSFPLLSRTKAWISKTKKKLNVFIV